jgi:uncharacterized protein YndB with AHSA1/START domain
MTEDPGAAIKGTLYSAEGAGVVRMKTRCETDIDDLWAALTEPQRLARWFGNVGGDPREGREVTVSVFASGWDGRVRIDQCAPPRQLRVTMWEKEVAKHVVTAELVADGDHTNLALEIRGVPLDVVWAYGAGWQEHVEDLRAHVAGQDRVAPTGSDARFDEIAPRYRAMTVVSLED